MNDWSDCLFAGLESLVLDFCSVPSDAFNELLAPMSQLRKLSVRGCSGFQDGNMSAVLRLRRLQSLNVKVSHSAPCHKLVRDS